MNNRTIAHLWANEKKESANGSNFFFEGESIYSYGYHFEAGRIVRNKRGEKAYLINSIHYSSTTSKHQYFVRSAIPTDSKIFSVGYNMSNTGNMAFVTSKLESIKDAIEKYKRVRTELPYRDVWGVFKNMMDYIEFFGMGTPQRYHKYPHPFYDDGVVKLYMPIPPISLALEGDRGILNIGEFKRKEIDYEQK